MAEDEITPSNFSEDVSDCGCSAPDSDSLDQGIVPEMMTVKETVMTSSSTAPMTLTVSGVPVTPSNLTINFNHYGGMMPGDHPHPHPHEEEPAAVVKVFEDKTVVKLPEDGIKVKILNENMAEKVGCYLNEEGECPVHEYTMGGWGSPSETVYNAPEEPYGDVKYADNGFRDNRKRYPIDSEAHVRAALVYINMPKNAAKYTSEQLELIKGRIHAAAKKYGIEVAEKEQEDAEAGTSMARYDVALLAGSAPLAPPASWFTNPSLVSPTRLTITEDGHVFGHLAQWRVCHVGIGNACVMAPKSYTNYGLFKVGTVVCDDGSEVPIGKIVMGSAHANAQWGVMPARDFYDNTSMTAAIVTVGEDKYGIWVNGALTSTMTPEKIAALRASSLSGDWRNVNGNLELIAALAVNSPGFPIYRTESGSAFSLQAVGIVGSDELTGVEMTDNPTEFSADVPVTDETPTGIQFSMDQEERQQRLQEIEETWGQHRRDQRLTQLAVLDADLDAFTEYRPRTYNYSNSTVIRGEYNGPKMRYLDDNPQEFVAEEELEDSEETPKRRSIKTPKRRR